MPIGWIVGDVFSDTNQCVVIANDVVVVPGLPGEIGVGQTDFFGANGFVLIDY